MKRRSFVLALTALLAGIWPRGSSARLFGVRQVSGIKAFCTCKGASVRVAVVADNPGIWFEVMGKHKAECRVNRMVKHWEKRGRYLIPPVPQGCRLHIGAPVVRQVEL